MPYRLDTETVERIGWILSALLFLLAIVSALGEVFGWWNDLGEIGMTVGTIGGLLVAFTTLIRGADSGEVQAVRQAVESNGETLSSLDDKADLQLDKLDTLDRVQLELDRQTGVLRDIRDLL